MYIFTGLMYNKYIINEQIKTETKQKRGNIMTKTTYSRFKKSLRVRHGKRYAGSSFVSCYPVPVAKSTAKRLSTTLFSIEYGILPVEYFEI